MIAKITNGAYFKGVLEYVLNPEKEYEVLAARDVLETDNVTVLSQQFIAQAKLSEKVKKPVWHAQLSFAKEDESLLHDELIHQVGEGYLQQMGITSNQYLIVKHNDTAHTHIHIVINRVTSQGKVLRDNMMKKRSMEAAKQLEKQYGLTVAALKGKAFSSKNLSDGYVYGFKPNKQLLRQDIKRAINEAKSRKFASFDAFEDYLVSKGIKMYKAQAKKEGIPTDYIALDYQYKFLDNPSKTVKETCNTLKLSGLGKRFSYEHLLSEIDFNQEKVPENIRETALQLENLFKNHKLGFASEKMLFAYLYFNDINVKHAYFPKAVEKAKLSKQLKNDLKLFKDENEGYMIVDVKLKKLIFKGLFEAIPFDRNMTFSFTKSDSEMLGSISLKKFYEAYLTHLNVTLPTPVKQLLINKKADNNTANYIISQLTGKNLPYHKRAVNTETATLCFNISGNRALKNEAEHQSICSNSLIIEAYKNFKNVSEDQNELVIFLAKRGIECKKVGGNMHFFHQGQDLGMATTFQVKVFSKLQSKKEKIISNEWLQSSFNAHYDEEKSWYYQLLDKRKIKEIGIELKKGKEFTLDEFDLKFIHSEFRNTLKKYFATQTFRGKLGIRFKN